MDDLFGFENLLWCMVGALTALALYSYGTSTHHTFKKMGIPYRKPLPFFGNTATIFSKSISEGQKDMINQEKSRMFGVFQGMTPVIECADIEFIKDVTIKEFPKFVDRRNVLAFETAKIFRYRVGNLQGEHWKRVRANLSPTFTSGKIKLMYPVIMGCGERLVTHLKTADLAPIAIKEYTSGYTMDVIVRTAFGVNIDVQAKINHPFVKHAGTFLGIPRKSTWQSRMKQKITLICVLTLPQPILKVLNRFGLSFLDGESVDYIYEIVNKILSERESSTQQGRDYISMCREMMVDEEDVDSVRVSTKDEKWNTRGITKDEVIANATAFLSAGFETTSITLQFFCYSMALNPEIQEKLYKHIFEVSSDGYLSYEELHKLEYLDWCVSETLRMYPPVLRVDRQANEDVTIRGVDLPKGQVVNILIYAVHHDPLYWENPEIFSPERFSPDNKTAIQQYAYLPFGAGGRSCIATRLGLLEVKVAVAKLIIAFRFEKTAATPEPEKLNFSKFTGFLHLAEPLKLVAISR